MVHKRSDSLSGIVISILLILAAFFALTLFIAVFVSLVWHWVVPDVFSGAVKQGILPADLSVAQAVKLSVLFSVLGLADSVAGRRSKK